MLRMNSVTTCYGPIDALKNVTLQVKKGEIVSLIGSNGAGKSTCLMTISGILKPSSGRVVADGTVISGMPPHKIVEMGVSQVPEGRRIFPRLTVLENLEMGAFLGRGDFSEM